MYQTEVGRATLAYALNQAGNLTDAEALFRGPTPEAETGPPDYPYIHSLALRYCELLGSRGNYEEVQLRARKALVWATEERSLIHIAWANLWIAQALLHRMRSGAIAPAADVAAYFEAALQGLRASGYQEELPRGLLARAEFQAWQGDTEGARADLDEAWQIAERGPMRLHLADIHLCRARLFGVQSVACRLKNEKPVYPWNSPQADLRAARQLIQSCGYRRRKAELEDAERVIGV